MSEMDPRAQLVVLTAVLLTTLFAGPIGLACGVAVAVVWTALAPARRRSLGPLIAVLPVALFVALLDALAGRAAEGVGAAVRLEATTAIALAFARTAEARAIADGLSALRVPYSLVFVLIAGARFVPVTAGDLGELVSAARLRGVAVDAAPLRRLAAWRVLLVPLLVITVRRGLQLGEAMEARGFSTASRRTIRTRLRWRGRDTIVSVAALGCLAAIALLGSRLG